MKYLLVFSFLIVSMAGNSQEDYILKVGDTEQHLSLDTNYEMLINSKKTQILLTRKDTLVHNESFYNFKYVKKHRISKAQIDTDIDQIMLMTAGGSGILIQNYASFNPMMLQEMMLNEITKESVSYGYDMQRKDYDKTLASGEKIRILKAVLEYKGEIETYEVTAYGKKDEGILIMTMDMDIDAVDGGKSMIDLFWKSLMIK